MGVARKVPSSRPPAHPRGGAADLAPTWIRCTFCKAKRLIERLFDGQPQYKALEVRFIAEIDAGKYTYSAFYPGVPTRRAIDHLLAFGGLPDEAWVDAIPVSSQTRATFRAELIGAGYLPLSAGPVKHKRSFGTCGHAEDTGLIWRAQQRIEGFFRPYVHLHPLRDHYIRQVEARIYSSRFFRNEVNQLWPLLHELGRDPRLISHTWLDTRRCALRSHVNTLRGDLIASGVLTPRSDYEVCVHVDSGLCRSGQLCTFCSAKRAVARLLDGHRNLDALKERLMEQIDRGRYTRRALQQDSDMGKALRALVELKEPPTHAWVDALSIQQKERDVFRNEMMVAGLLKGRTVELGPSVTQVAGPATARPKRGTWMPRITSVACAHRARGACLPCRGGRLIRAAFQDYPLLEPLRDRYLAQLSSGFYPRKYFVQYESPLWRYIKELGERRTLPEHDYLDAQYPSPVLRALREELIFCGLLERINEHPEVRRFELWAKRIINASELDEEARNIVERYRQLRMMSKVRRTLNRRSDNGNAIRGKFNQELRFIIDFTLHLNKRQRTLHDFDKTDAQALPAARLSRLRPFLLWLRENKISATPWIPKCVARNQVYRGIGIDALRLDTDRLLNDTSLPLDLRVLGILSYFGFTFPALGRLRASDVLDNDQISITGSPYDLEPTVAHLVRRLRDDLRAEVRTSRPHGWDPWLFASTDAIEQPSPIRLSKRLLEEGFRSRALRNESVRLGAQDATISLVTQQALGRASTTSPQHLKAFSSRAGSYAARLATARLEPELEI